MGLHLNYELRRPGLEPDHEVTRILTKLRAFAGELPFRSVSELYLPGCDAAGPLGPGLERLRSFASIIARPYPNDVPPLIGDAVTARGFFVDPGTRCETAIFGFLMRADEAARNREWFWHCSCKTQYASIVSDRHLVTCHTALVRLLDHAMALGVDVVVRDETHYWDTRDEQRLLDEVHAMNRVVARIAGSLGDAVAPEHDVRAPIFAHPRFERLEMGEEA